MRAQYFGMISEVDDQLGRVWDALRDARRSGTTRWSSSPPTTASSSATTACMQKLGYFESELPHRRHRPRSAPRRRPRRRSSTRFTENVDLFPTLCDAIGVDVPAQCDGVPLTPFLRGEEPPWWRDAAHWEYDWRDALHRRRRRTSGRGIGGSSASTSPCGATPTAAYVQFGDGSWLCFDLAADPTWRTAIDDPAVVLPLAQEMLTWRHATPTGRSPTC